MTRSSVYHSSPLGPPKAVQEAFSPRAGIRPADQLGRRPAAERAGFFRPQGALYRPAFLCNRSRASTQ